MSIVATKERIPQIVKTPPSMYRPTAAAGLSGADLVRILRKRKWLIIISLLIVIAITIVSTALWLAFAPLYTAEAFLAVEASRRGAFATSPEAASKDIVDRLTFSNAQMVRQQNVLTRVLQNPDVQKTQWYRRIPPSKNAVQELFDDLTVAPMPNTNFVRIAMTGTNRNDLAEIVMAVANEYVQQTREGATQERTEEGRKFEQERSSLAENLNRLRDQIAKQRPQEIGSLQQQTLLLTSRLQQLNTELIKLQMEQNQARATLENLEKQDPKDMAKLPDVQIMVDQDPNLRAMRISQINIATEYDAALKKFGSKHRTAMMLENRLKIVQDQVALRERELTAEQILRLKDMRKMELAGVTAKLLDAQKQFNQTTATVNDIQNNIEMVQQLTTQEAALVERMNKIDSTLLELRLMINQNPVSIRSRAEPPREPSMPQWKIMLPAGILLGLLIGFGLAFLLEFLDTSIKTPSDVSRRVDLPLLGMIPHTDDLEAEDEIADLRLAFMTHPHSLITESFRHIRTCLLFSGPAETRRSILVASPMPEDGRTTVTLNLAAAIAQGGHKVLVVDANLRQPMIHKLFPQCPPAGLTGALTGQARWQDQVIEVQPNLYVLASGALTPNPTELMGSDAMKTMLAEMTAAYDQVLLDGTPLTVVIDSNILSTLVDGVLLVVRAGASTHGLVQRTKDSLNRLGAHIIGVALNGIRVTSGGYLKKNYETFYEYRQQGESKLPSETT